MREHLYKAKRVNWRELPKMMIAICLTVLNGRKSLIYSQIVN